MGQVCERRRPRCEIAPSKLGTTEDSKSSSTQPLLANNAGAVELEDLHRCALEHAESCRWPEAEATLRVFESKGGESEIAEQTRQKWILEGLTRWASEDQPPLPEYERSDEEDVEDSDEEDGESEDEEDDDADVENVGSEESEENEDESQSAVISKVADRVYIGSLQDVVSAGLLDDMDITHIVLVSFDPSKIESRIFDDPNLTFCSLFLKDSGDDDKEDATRAAEQELHKAFQTCQDFMKPAIAEGGSVLIDACDEAALPTATAVVYLMGCKGQRLRCALEHVRKKWSRSCLSGSFFRALQRHDARLWGQTSFPCSFEEFRESCNRSSE